MKVLITGGKGRIASCLKKEIEGIYVDYDEMDITNKESVSTNFKKYAPEVVVHLAAITDVDYCEDHQKEVELINVTGTANIAEECKKWGCYLIHLSTDGVFDGLKGNYSENDSPNPINYYGVSKFEAEKKIQEIYSSNSLIMRIAYPFGVSEKSNLGTWIIRSLTEGKQITPHCDQIASPTYLKDITANIKKAIETRPTGILHCSGKEAINLYDFCVLVAEVKNLQTDTIKPIKVSENTKLKAKRPLNTSLNVQKGLQLGFKYTDLRKAVEEIQL